jgi:NAD(P)-dependent dehydrogenase (short-subunit alcohol dehydrogenase family)
MILRRFENRVTMVTGGASGIGLAIVEWFAEEGAGVALLDWEEKRGQAASEQIRAVGVICEFFPVDVASESQVTQALNGVAGRFQGVDHFVNNAGMVVVKGIEECTAEEWDRVIDVNLKSISSWSNTPSLVAFSTTEHRQPRVGFLIHRPAAHAGLRGIQGRRAAVIESAGA